MKIYLVGGAVRDKLLDLHVSDRDWVVIGATIDEMLNQGYQQVGKDFPVFLHPSSKEEYALARTERKSGKGYTGFECISDSSVTLEQDLLRRDLTINAIAEDSDGNLIDPYHGVEDLNNRILRHVSEAFAEDPLRVLRVARFAARFSNLGFSIADETLALMQQMTSGGELNELTAERVWKETEKALTSKNPEVYFQILRDCGALKVLFPEIDALFGVPQTEKHHPEIDTGIHTLLVLQQATLLSHDISVRFAALTHDLGKGITPADILPRHLKHETTGIPLVKQLCERLRVPKNIADLARLVCEFHLHSHRALTLKAKTLEKLFRNLDLYRRPERLIPFVQACEADAKGRLGFEAHPYPQADYLQQCFAAAARITINDIDTTHLKGPAIGEALQRAKVTAIAKVKANYPDAEEEED